MGAFILVFINTTEAITTQVQTKIKHLQSSDHDWVALVCGAEGGEHDWGQIFQYE